MQPPFFSALYALAINYGPGRTGLSRRQLSAFYVECVMDPIQGSIVIPAIQVVMHRAAGWKVFGNISPLTAGADQVHASIQDFS